VHIPKKASKLHPLTKEEKKQNRELSSKRILVENKICQLKVFDILDEKYRNKQKRF
jgi:ribosomal protein L35